MNIKSFSLLGFFLVCVLVMAVTVNFIITMQCKTPFDSDIDQVQKELSELKQVNKTLQYHNRILAEDAAKRVHENIEMRNFLDEMEYDISEIARLSTCTNCCDVGGKVVNMGPAFFNYHSRIAKFLNKPMTASGITILSPNGFEIWGAGNTEKITWTSYFTGKVTIEYSIDNGETWTTLINTPDDGLYTWTVPYISSGQCLVKISNAETESYDISNTTFSIEVKK